MNKFKHAAWIILSEEKTPMHYGEITRLSFARNLLQSEGKTPESSMNAQLITDIKVNSDKSVFIKTAPAIYALNPSMLMTISPFIEEKDSLSIKNVSSSKSTSQVKLETYAQVAQEKSKVDGSFIGKAGEHWVCAELLMRGFNASIMSVDVGMDIIATRNHQLFSLQVKAARLSTQNSYLYDIREVALARGYSGAVFYVFVMFDPQGHKDCVVIPSHKMDELIHLDAIKSVTNDKVRVTLKVRGDVLYIGTKAHEITYYWNNWALIR